MRRLSNLLFGAVLAFDLIVAGMAILSSPLAHAAKNVVAKSWQLATCFDGKLYSRYADGSCPSALQTAPTILFTDIVSGSTTNGEGGKGAYVGIYGYSFGRPADLGTSVGARVFFRTNSGPGAWQEVDNYRVLAKSPTYSVNQIMYIVVQIGSLGGVASGTAMDIKVTVGVTDTNVLTNGFTTQVGNFWFVSNQNGNDGTGVKNQIGNPYRYVQNYGGGTGAPVSGSVWDATTGLRAGDTVVIRGGTTYIDAQGYEGKWMRFPNNFTYQGSTPTGAAGHGYVHFTSYPGPIKCSAGGCTSTDVGGNAPEDVYWQGSSTSAGGMYGAHSNFATAYWTASRIRAQANNTQSTLADGTAMGAINGGDHVRFVANDLSWPNADTSRSPTGPTSAGLDCGGMSNAVIYGNYIHDVNGGTQNHGIYCSSGSTNLDVAYNWVYNAHGGSAIQMHDQNVPTSFGTGNSIHHNYIDTTLKYGINLGSGVKQMDVYDNVIANCGRGTSLITDQAANGVAVQPTNSPYNINIVHNTFYNCDTVTGPQDGSIIIAASFTGASVAKIMHNNVLLGTNRSTGGSYYNAGSCCGGTDTNVTLDWNLYFDYKGTVTARPAKDGGNSVNNQNPLIGKTGGGTWAESGSTQWTLTGSSPGLTNTTTEPISVPTDFYGVTRPQGVKASVGATEGVGL